MIMVSFMCHYCTARSKAIAVIQTLALHTQICSMLTSAMLLHV